MKFAIIPENNSNFAGEWGYLQLKSNAKRTLPESLARKGLENGARVYPALNGFEGQIFENSSIVASRWWKNRPTVLQWKDFCRTSGSAAQYSAVNMIDTVEVPFRKDIPFLALSIEQIEGLLRPRNLAVAVLTVFMCSIAFLSGQYGRHYLNIKKTDSKMRTVEATAGKILSQRRRAISNLKYAHKIQDLGSPSLLLVALDEIGQVFAETDYTISRLSLATNDLELTLQGKDVLSVPDIVTKLEAKSSLSEVTISLKDDIIKINSYLNVPRIKDVRG